MGTKHLTEADRFRARTLFFDAGLPKTRICQITGFSLNQVKLAIREKTPKTRSGRPPRRRPPLVVGPAGPAGTTGTAETAATAAHPVAAGHGEGGRDASYAYASGAAEAAATATVATRRGRDVPAVSSARFASWPGDVSHADGSPPAARLSPGPGRGPSPTPIGPSAVLPPALRGGGGNGQDGDGRDRSYYSSSSSSSSLPSATPSLSSNDGSASGGFSVPSILATPT
ncbi:hypothetical protein SPI_03091 [Niveomyces insectorum RCEF 264]|uniref:Uncharacterized protein n=1 Tax=Niveomyces insectorum RCEF 264 TaxID=1081102 RepID=A0A167X289_9HYPO|nr:hypothetical protein SPI_03091 [Niveomyces insectorum RCEF 264]